LTKTCFQKNYEKKEAMERGKETRWNNPENFKVFYMGGRGVEITKKQKKGKQWKERKGVGVEKEVPFK